MKYHKKHKREGTVGLLSTPKIQIQNSSTEVRKRQYLITARKLLNISMEGKYGDTCSSGRLDTGDTASPLGTGGWGRQEGPGSPHGNSHHSNSTSTNCWHHHRSNKVCTATSLRTDEQVPRGQGNVPRPLRCSGGPASYLQLHVLYTVCVVRSSSVELRLLPHTESGSSAHNLHGSSAEKPRAVGSKRTPGETPPRESVRLQTTLEIRRARAEQQTCVLPESMALST